MQLPEVITSVKTVAERLQQARLAAKLTQGKLAVLASVSQGTIGNIEAGLRKKPRELLAIAEVLGVSAQWLQSGKGPMKSATPPSPTSQALTLPDALPVVLEALLSLPLARWASVRAQLDQVVAHPEMRDEVLPELVALLSAVAPGKRQARDA